MLLNIHTCSGKGLRPHYMQLSAGDIIGGIHSYDLDDKSTKSTILFVRIYFIKRYCGMHDYTDVYMFRSLMIMIKLRK